MAYTIIAIGLICATIYYMPGVAIGYLVGFVVGYKYDALNNWLNKVIKEREEQKKKKKKNNKNL